MACVPRSIGTATNILGTHKHRLSSKSPPNFTNFFPSKIHQLGLLKAPFSTVKRVGDGDTGPNTGGMGAYSPAPVLTKELESVVIESIIIPTVKGMANEGCKFVGVLMVRLESDLAQVLVAACKEELSGVSLDWSPGSAMVVVMASKGYLGSYEKGTVIQNLEEAEQLAPFVKVFHAGTSQDADGNFMH